MNIIKFKTKDDLENQLVKETVAKITELQDSKKNLFLLFSGGSTPKLFLQKLAKSDISWNSITVSLADERLVDEMSEHSNKKFLYDNLINRIDSEKPQFLSLVLEPNNELENIKQVRQDKKLFQEPDISFLGMGTDGHFASLFPNDNNSSQGLKENNSDIILNTMAPVSPKKRISYSLNHLIKSKYLFLFCTGHNKLNILNQTPLDNKLPIHDLLQQGKKSISIYWAP